MSSINQFQAIGCINRPPQYYENENSHLITFTVKVTRNYLSRNQRPMYDFLNCKAYGEVAIQIKEAFKEDIIVAISGQIQTRRFFHNDEKRYATELLVTQFYPFIPSQMKSTCENLTSQTQI
ncbi:MULTISPECIES: single-stranded DNA-binding protein [Staphylococcus]|uniref:Single-stranded DNA-binding protein n=1 Tax=Staphylococcus schleiferi TaxID=1295 RepID=A0A7Z7QNX7_STASC|nr:MULTISPECIES: single-stranded DNA-binding protein [Staphylococcus]QGS45920.1 single-stranded DNA-binding protein [Mammaliicoccus fleurettii]EPD48004.1 hypothetical protein HMPREF1208_02270 [Staphylococcus sp. HGB0015]NHA34841.1 single-stranded DNA-binding protein [Staphylococcus schleiferi]NHA38984.1 single-stranded DNA-binding protein [Staphylococcus schleiferi]NHA41091.1 single-stranded DNA-binding protein [Staphylococcus schleiferi]